MNKFFSLLIICILLCLKINHSLAQSSNGSLLVGTWIADTSNTLNNKTGIKKADFDFIWSKFVFNLDGSGKILWNYRTDGGGHSYFNWDYSPSDSVLKITSKENNVGYYKLTHITDSSIDMVNWESKYPKKGQRPKSQEERKYVKNELLGDDFSSNPYSYDAVPVYSSEKLQFIAGNKYFTGEYHFTINLFDMSGKQIKTLLFSKTVPSNTVIVQNLNFKDVPPGIYILSISDGNTLKGSLKIEKK